MKKIQNKILNESNIKSVEQIYKSEFIHDKKSLTYKLNGTEIYGVVGYSIENKAFSPVLIIEINLSKATVLV